jgi:hypothetical protein
MAGFVDNRAVTDGENRAGHTKLSSEISKDILLSERTGYLGLVNADSVPEQPNYH